MTVRGNRWVPISLIVLSLVPVAAGAFRVTQLASGGEVNEGNARFFDAPVPVILHIIGASVYCLLGAFQFDNAFRRRRPGWHRIAGRLLVPCGLTAALSGIWMTLFYDVPANDGEIVAALRLFFGTAMVFAIVLGLLAIRRRDFTRHRAWMIRGYAIGIGAGTQAFTHLPWALAQTTPDETGRAIAMGAGWLINVAVAEWAIRRSHRRPSSGGDGRAARVGREGRLVVDTGVVAG